MKIIITLISFVSLNLSAACPELAKPAVGSVRKNNIVNASSYSAFSPALKHYRSEIQSTFKEFIERSSTYFKGHELSGFEVTVYDGGDESTVRYVFNGKKKLIVAYLYNQSPVTYWFCGNNTSFESEYTEEGSEIR
jgi:hypothetical protein